MAASGTSIPLSASTFDPFFPERPGLLKMKKRKIFIGF